MVPCVSAGSFVFNCDATHIVVTMKMFMGLFGTKKHETILVIEISSGEVAGAFFLRERGLSPLILDTARREFPRRDFVDPVRLQSDMLTALEDTCAQLQKTFPGRPQSVYVVLGTPWAHVDIRSIEYRSNHDIKFTEKMGMKMMTAEMKKLSAVDISTALMDHRTVQVLLNGYPADKPHGMMCRVVELRALFSFAPEELLSIVRDRIHRTWKAKTNFTSSALSNFVVLRDILPGTGGALIINVGAEATEIVLALGNGKLSGTATIPVGERTIIRKAGEMLRKGALETDSLFSLMRSGSLDQLALTKADEAFSYAREYWQEGIKTVLHSLVPSRQLPDDILFSSHTPMNEYLRDGMTPNAFPEFTASTPGFNAIIADMNMLHGSCRWKDGAVRDPRIAMDAIFISRS